MEEFSETNVGKLMSDDEQFAVDVETAKTGSETTCCCAVVIFNVIIGREFKGK